MRKNFKSNLSAISSSNRMNKNYMKSFNTLSTFYLPIFLQFVQSES